MRRGRLVFAGLFVVLAGVLAPPALVGAAPAGDRAGSGGPVAGPRVERSESGSYVVVMDGLPLAATEPRESLDSPQAQAKAASMRASHERAMQEAGADPSRKVHDYTVALNGFSALLDHDDAVALAARDDVLLVLPDEMRQKQTDSSPDFLGLTGPGGAYRAGFDGDGVIVGVIDTGIWPEHPSFADDGTYSRHNRTWPCEFGNAAHNPGDAPFTCNNKLLGAHAVLDTYRAVIGLEPGEFDSARDNDGHGTHTASTAAGNAGVRAEIGGRNLGRISGIAPRAHIIAYKAIGAIGGFGSDLAAAIDRAVADGVDVINYSIGGGARLLGPDTIAFLFAEDAGVFASVSAGNDGPGPATIGGPANVPWVTTVGASTQPRSFDGRVTLGDGATFIGAMMNRGTGPAPLVDAAGAGGDLCEPGTLDPGQVAGAIVLCRRGIFARVDKSRAVLDAGGVGMILYNTVDDGDRLSDTHWVPTVFVGNAAGLAIKAYLASAASPTAQLEPDLGTLPYAPSMTSFSSRGPNPVGTDIVKPDVTAPGIQILAGSSPMNILGGPPGELFEAMAGTSMSAPHVAGLGALLADANPDWTPAMAKSALMTTARRDVVKNDTVTPADPFDVGAGHVDPRNAKRRGSVFQPGLVYDAGFLDYLGFLCDAAPEAFADPARTCADLAGRGVPTDASDLNIASIGVADLAGTQTVTRRVTSVAPGTREYTAHVDAPPGYVVSVSPSTLRIGAGATETFTVRIRRVDGPVGEWRFGSLTWEDSRGEYSARSPIAVHGKALNAPASVAGSGMTGSAGIDIQFGYGGQYAANPHGLEPARLDTGNVLQDPDQQFDPGDGFSQAHTFTLDDALHLRFRMPPEATEPDADLDLFLIDPNGDLVAASFLAGTDESIDVSDPMDGIWTLWVHGWAAPGGDSDYTLFSWTIDGAPGGSLTVDSAPPRATKGDTATVGVSWTSAAAGEWHLGAVTHWKGRDRIGVTLVEVDNR